MSPISDAYANSALDSREPNLISLHSGYPGADGLSNELSGGSPAYARAAATVNAASGRARALDADVPVNVPAGANVRFIGLWNSTGPTWLGYSPNGPASNYPKGFSVKNTGDVLTSAAHGFSDNDTVIVLPIAGISIPTGLAEGTVYYVISATTDTLQLSATQGGAAVTISADGSCLLQEIITETYAQQGVHTVKAGTILQM